MDSRFVCALTTLSVCSLSSCLLVSRFRALEALCEQMLFQRALAKMYNSNTTFKGGKGAHPGKGLATQTYRLYIYMSLFIGVCGSAESCERWDVEGNGRSHPAHLLWHPCICVVAVRFERAKRRLNRTMEKIDHAKEQLKVRTNSTPD